jgi:hypothetical protein
MLLPEAQGRNLYFVAILATFDEALGQLLDDWGKLQSTAYLSHLENNYIPIQPL